MDSSPSCDGEMAPFYRCELQWQRGRARIHTESYLVYQNSWKIHFQEFWVESFSLFFPVWRLLKPRFAIRRSEAHCTDSSALPTFPGYLFVPELVGIGLLTPFLWSELSLYVPWHLQLGLALSNSQELGKPFESRDWGSPERIPSIMWLEHRCWDQVKSHQPLMLPTPGIFHIPPSNSCPCMSRNSETGLVFYSDNFDQSSLALMVMQISTSWHCWEDRRRNIGCESYPWSLKTWKNAKAL